MSADPRADDANDTGEFAARALDLFRAGHRVVPIEPGTKECKKFRWSTWAEAQTEAQIVGATRPGAGVGIWAKRTAGIDNDVRDFDLVQSLIRLAEDVVGGVTHQRIGLPPKVLLPYRVEKPFKKLSTKAYVLPGDAPGTKPHKVEVLCDGQMWVAYGTHPDTGNPYHWPDGDLPAWEDLPELTEAMAREFIARAEALIIAAGGKLAKAENPFLAAADRMGVRKQLTAKDLVQGSIHDWQLRMSGRLVHFGVVEDRIVSELLEATRVAIGLEGGTWDWVEEEQRLRGMIQTAADKGYGPTPLDTSWGEPGELPSGLPPVEPFDPAMLPKRLRTWAMDIAERMQAPIDYVAVGGMVAFGAAVGRRIAIWPKEYDDWSVVPNLWGTAIGRPAMMKSPTLKEATWPLVRLEMAAKKQHDQAMSQHEIEQLVAKQMRKANDAKILEAVKKGDEKEAAHVAKVSLDAKAPVRKRYVVTNTTMEAMGIALAANPCGVLLSRDELVGFFRSMDRDGHQEDRSFYLEAWAGDSRYSHDRVERGILDIEACCVSVLGGIQPGPLTTYLRSMARGGEDDDGLIQRLQLMVWPDTSKDWRNVDRKPDLAARADVEKLFEGIDAIVARAKTATPTEEEMGPDDEGRLRAAIPYLRFDPDAQLAFNSWRETLELRLRGDELHPALEAHLAKYRSLIPSLALLFHIADAEPGTELGPVEIEAFAAAEAWHGYLESHAHRVYDSIIRADLWSARVLGQRIQKGDLTSPFTLRDVYRNCWSGLENPAAAEAAVAVLIEINWLQLGISITGSQGGRPSPQYHVNPAVMGAAP